MAVATVFAAVYVPLVSSLSACDGNDKPNADRQQALAIAPTLTPADASLANLYKQSCKACHAVEGSGAPLVHDRTQWDARWNKGLSTLVQSVVTGINGMPAGGQCFACTAQDYEALIKFLADRE